jgi:hypothetical protein
MEVAKWDSSMGELTKAILTGISMEEIEMAYNQEAF